MPTTIQPIGQTQAQTSRGPTNTFSQVDLSLDPVKPWTVPDVPETDVAGSETRADEQFTKLSDMLSDLRSVNSARLKGEVPKDVAQAVRVNSAENLMAGGVGLDSPAARNITASDMGMTSMDIQDRGMAFEAQLTNVQQALTTISEERYRFRETLSETRRAFQEQSRQFGANLEQDALRTQLMHRELLLKQDTFNKELNLKLLGMMSELTMNQMSMQLNAAVNNVADSAMTAGYNSLLTQINSLTLASR